MFDFSPGNIDLTLSVFVAGLKFMGALLIAGLGATALLRAADVTISRGISLAIGLILGPIAYAWIAALMLRFIPGQAGYLYPLGALLPFILVIFIAIVKNPKAAIGAILWFGPDVVPARDSRFFLIWTWAALGTLGLAVLMIGITFFVPLHGNDSLEYASVARLIAQKRSILDYPYTNPENGFYGPWTHPPGYVATLALGYLIQGHTEFAGAIRLAALYFTLVLTLLIGFAAEAERRGAGFLASFLFISTPLILHMTIQNHIDPIRIAGFFAAVVLGWHFCQKPGMRSAVVLGIAAGLAYFTHSIGILTLPLILPAVALFAPVPLLRRFLLCALALSVALSVTALNMADNLRLYGSILSDTPFIWTLPEIPIQMYFAYTRDLDGVLSKIVFGILKGFTFINDFGYSYIIILIIFTAFFFKDREDIFYYLNLLSRIGAHARSVSIVAMLGIPIICSFSVFMLLIAFIFYIFLIMTVFIGTDIAIKNSRYFLTVQPIIVILSAVLISKLFKRKEIIISSQSVNKSKDGASADIGITP